MNSVGVKRTSTSDVLLVLRQLGFIGCSTQLYGNHCYGEYRAVYCAAVNSKYLLKAAPQLWAELLTFYISLDTNNIIGIGTAVHM